MKRLATIASFLLVLATVAFAQPMSGDYTVGGTSPSFATLQDAANAIKAHGVSGPVFINIRPGIYVRWDAQGPLLLLDSTIAGISSTNRLVFQPDAAAGGNVDNVILEADFNASSPPHQSVINLGTDYTTLRALTFKDADSMGVPADWLIRIAANSVNATIEGLVVTGCKFFGPPYNPANHLFGTGYGLYATGELTSAVVTGNFFKDLWYGIDFGFAGSAEGDVFDIDANRFEDLFVDYSGSGERLGAAIQVACAYPTVRNNIIRSSSGASGIETTFPIFADIEKNYVQGAFDAYISVNNSSRVDSATIINNIVLASGGGLFGDIYVLARNVKIFNNTIIHFGAWDQTLLYLNGSPQCTVLNNIMMAFGDGCGLMIAFNSAPGFISNHNVFFSRCPAWYGSVYYYGLFQYQGAGFDTNSVLKDIPVQYDSLGLRFDDCEAQDPALRGIPLAEVSVDFYGARRDLVKPFVGAVEGKHLPYDMFGSPYKAGLSGAAFSVTAADLDGDGAPEIAIPDYDNGHVLIFHNNSAGRSFTQTGTLTPGFAPTLVRFFDLDHDSHQDLIVAGEANAVRVYWGNGAGSFSSDTTLTTIGRPRSLDTGAVSFFGYRTIVLTEDNGFLPNTSFLCYLDNGNGRHLSEVVVTAGDDVHGRHPDTLAAVLGDFVCADLKGNGSQQVAALSNYPIPTSVYFFTDTTAGNIPWGHHVAVSFGTGTYLGMTSSIAAADFDGDHRLDLLTTGAFDNNCVLLHNQGNAVFVAETLSTSATRGIAVLDYNHDGHPDFVTANRMLDSLGISVFLNDGRGHFAEYRNCFFPFASGDPYCIIGADFDRDGKTDIAVVSRAFGGFDSLFVLYNLGGFNGTTGVDHQPVSETPQGFALLQNYPNPFNPSTRIEYTLPAESDIAIRVYNILGQEIATLVNEQQTGGRHVVEWNGRSTNGLAASSGVYFYRIEARQLNGQFQYVSVKKMLLLK